MRRVHLRISHHLNLMVPGLLVVLLCVGCASPASLATETDPPNQQPRPYDPYEGIAEDGSIPKVDMPADIKNPDRWRYIPEGRIPPGNIIKRLLVTSFIAPFLFFEGDIGPVGCETNIIF